MYASNQRLELLADAVLKLTAALYYYQKYPDTPANNFRTFKGSILSNDALGSLFASLGLDTFLNTGLADSVNSEAKLKKDARRAVYLRNLGITGWANLDFSRSSIGEKRKFVEVDDEEITSGHAANSRYGSLCTMLLIMVCGQDIMPMVPDYAEHRHHF
ncbi:hypothetical protein BGZ79_005518 [Entomortierella chlamydospora]|nr:hypothetical protein BGZ79_005518 [Entomortierella chlamydospora]